MAASERQASVMRNRRIMDIYERRQKAQWDYASAMSGARREGREEVARNALAKGIPAELVCDITGLDMETVSGLKV